MHKGFDVAIAGGGPAGAAAAIRLARAGLRVVLADGDDRHDDKIGESLAPSARLVLERIGVWEQFRTAGHRPCYANRSSWGHDEVETYEFLRDPHGHGWHIDRRRFEVMLAGEAARAGCWWLSQTSLRRLARSADGWRLTVAAGAAHREITARFVVDATGRASRVARSLGARREIHDRLVALVAFLAFEAGPGPDGGTLVEAVADGWWYTARLPDRRLACAFVTDADVLCRSGGRSPTAWQARLACSVHTRARVAASGQRLAGSPIVVAAGSAIVNPVAGPGWLAAGDAAAAYDPLSSHGIAAAIAGGWDAAAVVLGALDGDPAAVHVYAQRLRRSFTRYLEVRAAYYEMEERWPGSPFWRRRSTRDREAEGLGACH
jgi:flavin-dependent dehydrogenase